MPRRPAPSRLALYLLTARGEHDATTYDVIRSSFAHPLFAIATAKGRCRVLFGVAVPKPLLREIEVLADVAFAGVALTDIERDALRREAGAGDGAASGRAQRVLGGRRWRSLSGDARREAKAHLAGSAGPPSHS